MQKSIIAILDILGTKGLWSEGNVESYFRVIEENNQSFSDLKRDFIQKYPDSPIEIDFMSFSDTLIITLSKTIKDDLRDPYFFHEYIAGFSQLIAGVFQKYLAHSFFLRGAISFEDLEKRGSHFVGPVVDDAEEYFELPDMMGVVLTPKVSLLMDNAIEWNAKYYDKKISDFLIKFKTPMKSNVSLDLYQVNWTNHFFDKEIDPNDISPVATLKSFFSDRNIPLIATSKYNNTIEFFEYAQKNYNNKVK